MLAVVKSPQEEELELGDCQEADTEGGESSRNSGSVGGLCVCEGEQEKQHCGSERGELSALLGVLRSHLLQKSSPANSWLRFPSFKLGLGRGAGAARPVSRKVTHSVSLCRCCPLPSAAPGVVFKPRSWCRVKYTFPTPISPHLILDTQPELCLCATALVCELLPGLCPWGTGIGWAVGGNGGVETPAAASLLHRLLFPLKLIWERTTPSSFP